MWSGGVSHTTLLALAAAVWLLGAVATGDLGMRLLEQVEDESARWISLGCAVGLGVLLGATFFKRLANGNIDRIDSLHRPKFWEAYRWRFYILLVVFDGGSVVLSDYFAKDDVSRLAIGALDLTICVALSLSLLVYGSRYRSDFGTNRGAGKSPLLWEEDAQADEVSGGSDKTGHNFA